MRNDKYHSYYKVIAGVVQSDDDHPNNLKVVSIGTGSKFLYDKYLDRNIVGNTVLDTHAEVVARRGLMRHIYNEVNQCLSNSSIRIFEKTTDSIGSLKLRSNIKFHLYVSTVPCGDARVYNNNDQTSAIPRGQLRTKGQGALTTSKDANPDDATEANCMSCSAKILKWNILGIQGALLSKIIEPVYLSSIIFGEKFKREQMKQSLYGRINKEIAYLPKRFNMQQPILMQVFQTKAKPAVFSPNHSVNWNGHSEDVEILESTSGCTIGKDKTKIYSRISKRAFFNEYHKVEKKLKHQEIACVYTKAKLDIRDYQVYFCTFLKVKLL